MSSFEKLLFRPPLRRNINEPGWLGSKVTERDLAFPTVLELLPEFERRPFAFYQPDGTLTSVNPRLDTILRKPTKEDHNFQPVGVVGVNYGLVSHRELVNAVDDALRKAGIEDITRARLTLTEFGERMHLCIVFPDRFSFDPGDGNRIKLRLEVINSVDGSSRLRILLSWFRLVCSNGLVVGVTQMDVYRRHVRGIEPNEVLFALPDRLKEAKEEMETLTNWREIFVELDILEKWVNGPLKKAWGVKAAARTWLICIRGADGEPTERYEKSVRPSTLPMNLTMMVPGAPSQSNSLFDVSQALAWIAKERNEVEERIQWRSQIPSLIEELM